MLARLQSLVQQSLVAPLRESGRYRHLAWIDESFGFRAVAQTSDAETSVHEDRIWAEVENAIAAMEWAEETGDADALFGVFIGFAVVWHNDSRYARVGLSWLERVPIPPATDPLAHTLWLVASGLMHFNLGDLDTSIKQFLEGATYVDVLRAGDPDQHFRWSPGVFFRANMYASLGDYDAALADAALLAQLADVDRTHQAWMLWMSYAARAPLRRPERRGAPGRPIVPRRQAGQRRCPHPFDRHRPSSACDGSRSSAADKQSMRSHAHHRRTSRWRTCRGWSPKRRMKPGHSSLETMSWLAADRHRALPRRPRRGRSHAATTAGRRRPCSAPRA